MEDTISLRKEIVLPIGLRKRESLTLFAQRLFKSLLTEHLVQSGKDDHQVSKLLLMVGNAPKLIFSGQNGVEKNSLGCGFFGGKTSCKASKSDANSLGRINDLVRFLR